MDSALLVTFASVLSSLQLRCKGDVVSCSADELALMAEYLSEAMDWAWKFPQRPWPNTIEGDEVTLVNGVIQWGTVYYANFWEVYRSDPRPLPPSHPWPAPVPCRRDADGIWPLHGIGFKDVAPTTLFVLFQRRAAEFTMNLVLPATEYQIGDVVYDGASGKTGDCYRSLAAQTTPTPPDAQLADATLWERQEIPRFLREPVLAYAKGGWMQDKTEEDKADSYRDKAEKALENEWFNQKESD